MKLVHVIPSLSASTGGTAFATAEMALAVQRQGVDVSIFTTDLATPPQAKARRLGVTLDEMPAAAREVPVRIFEVKTPMRMVYSPQLASTLNSAVAECDLIHIHSLFLHPQFAAYRAARRHKVPYIVSPHGALDPYLRQRGRFRKRITDAVWQRQMLNHAALILLTSEIERLQLLELGFRAPLVVGPFGIGTEWFSRSTAQNDFRERFLGKYSGPLVMFHGRLAKKKGLNVLIEAFSLVIESGIDCRLVIIGPDDEDLGTALRSQAERLGIRQLVCFVDILRGQDLRMALSAGTIWAMPSRGENFGLAVVEALASGLPVIVSPEVNIAEEIDKDGAGLVTAGSADHFASAILSLLKDPPRLELLASAAVRFAERYNWRSTGPEMADLYEKALRHL